MNEHTDNLEADAPEGPTALCWVAIVVVGIAFFCIEHNPVVSRMEMFGTTQDELEANAAGGKLAHQAGFTLLALLGAALLLLPGGRRLRVTGVLPALMGLVAFLCLASALWSINPMQTVKRDVLLMMCFMLALGMARQLSARQVCWLCLIILTCHAATGVAAEVALGTFKPWSADYRFAGTMHPNGQGSNCALLCLAAGCLLRGADRGRIVLLLLFGFGIALMLLTRSRTPFVALLGGLAALVCLRPSPSLVAGVYGLAWSAGAAALIGLFAGLDVVESLPDVLSLGRAEHISTLTGRTELWEELVPYVMERPLLGYGCGSFWNVDHIDDVSQALYWDLSSAHSTYLEMVLAAGLIGGAALILLLAAGLWQAGKQYRKTNDCGDALVFALLVFTVISGVSESELVVPSFMTLIVGFGLNQLAFFAREA
jgi:exopolysaccharide production protein ExoQ